MTTTTEIRMPRLDTSQSVLNRQENENHAEETEGFRSMMRKQICLLNGVNHVFIIFLTCFICFFVSKTSSVMYYHVVLCTVGYILLMSEAILVFANENIGTFFFSPRVRAHLHWILQVFGAAFSIAGFLVMYLAKSRHFQSIHAITGITSIAIMAFLIVFGYPVLVSVRLRKLIRPVIIRFVHNFLGICSFVIGIVSLCYGLKKKVIAEEDRRMSINDITYAILVITILSTILTVMHPFRSLYTQFKALFG